MFGRCCITVSAFILGLSSAAAELPDIHANEVQTLHAWCKMPPASPQHAACAGYISAIGDTLIFLSFYKQKHENLQDFPYVMCGTPSSDDMVKAFTNWAAANPQEGASDKMIGVVLALRKSWPCPSK
jgi:Rap1a immunity proteins